MSDKSRNTNNQEYVGHISTEHNLSNIYDYCIEMCSIINKYLSITHTYALLHSKSARSGTHSTVIFLNSPFIKKKKIRDKFCFVSCFIVCYKTIFFEEFSLGFLCLIEWLWLMVTPLLCSLCSTIHPMASAGSSSQKKVYNILQNLQLNLWLALHFLWQWEFS